MSRSLRIACFGDSLTEGFGLPDHQALPSVLQDLLREQGLDARCENFGVSGDTSADGLARLKPVLRSSAQVCVVAFGTNDFFLGMEPEATEDNLAAILEALRGKDIAPVIAGVRCLEEFGMEYKQAFDAVFPRLAERFAAPLLPDLLAPYFGRPEYTLIDQLHPNAAGVRAMAEALLPVLRQALGREA